MHTTAVARTGAPAPELDLARRLHHTVAQRLAGLAYLLAADQPLADEALDRCRSEVEAALSELRDALSSVSVASGGERGGDVDAELRALLDAFPALDLQWRGDDVLETEPGCLVEGFLVEALRNIRKHAQPTQVVVDVAEEPGVTVVEVANDGIIRRKRASCGAGRRLLELEASLHGALVESARQGAGRWSQRLILPTTEERGRLARSLTPNPSSRPRSPAGPRVGERRARPA